MATILLVEDDPDLRLLTARALERAGHRVTALADGAALSAMAPGSVPSGAGGAPTVASTGGGVAATVPGASMAKPAWRVSPSPTESIGAPALAA